MASGGGVHSDNGYFVSKDSLFEDNMGASKGGGVGLNGNGKAFIYSTNIVGNQGQEGGGIYLSGGQRLVLHDSALLGNTTSGLGGGVLAEGAASIRGTYFDGNGAGNKGGAITYNDGSLTLSGCEFGDDNSAAQGQGPKLAQKVGTQLTAQSGGNENFDPVQDTFWFT